LCNKNKQEVESKIKYEQIDPKYIKPYKALTKANIYEMHYKPYRPGKRSFYSRKLYIKLWAEYLKKIFTYPYYRWKYKF